MKLVDPLVVHIPDTRGVTISPFGRGNLKIGPDVFTYSRLPGLPTEGALGGMNVNGTCPGASRECQEICYARRPVMENGPVAQMWAINTQTETVPEDFPPGTTLVRLHISGDFTSVRYIQGWTILAARNPEVIVWAYTRSWRVPSLLPSLEALRALPNVQLFASMDASIPEVPPVGWRRAWIDGDARAGIPVNVEAHSDFGAQLGATTFDGTPTYVCPEETKHKTNCQECGYCFAGKRNDVTFLKH